ncbi:MAG: hypothetical protein Q9170_006719 [Blastenia crenularia]
MILLIPIPLIWQLQTSRKNKIRILMVFTGGIAACVAIVARMVVVFTQDINDVTYSIGIVILLVCAEVNLGIICSCLPILPVFYQYIAKTAKSKPSTYYELEPVLKSSTGVERARITNTDTERGSTGRTASEPALHRQYLEFNGYKKKSPFMISSGAAYHDPREERLHWNGEGILKTVELDRIEESFSSDSEALPRMPQNAMFRSESSNASGFTKAKRSLSS